jgi:hypothetical protein
MVSYRLQRRFRGLRLITTVLCLTVVLLVWLQYIGMPYGYASISNSERRNSYTNSSFVSENTIDSRSQNMANYSAPRPVVIFPTYEQLVDYLASLGGKGAAKIYTFLANSSLGDTIDIQAAQTKDSTYVVWQGRTNSTSDHVYLSLTRGEGRNFTEPIELTLSNTGNISNLQIVASPHSFIPLQESVYVVWQAYNTSSGVNSIYVSTSMDSGKEFKSYQASNNTSDARDPVVTPNGLIFWEQECTPPTGGGGPFPDPLPGTESCPVYHFRW